ncbi:hypothetical protein ACTGJ9_018370 [Bradyrhizobium sp. RDM12]
MTTWGERKVSFGITDLDGRECGCMYEVMTLSHDNKLYLEWIPTSNGQMNCQKGHLKQVDRAIAKFW